MFFRLTWQHIDGTLNTAADFQKKTHVKPFYLLPTCVPLVSDNDKVYLEEAPGFTELAELTKLVPEKSTLNSFARQFHDSAGYFWADVAGSANRLCIHESLYLKGEERVVVFDAAARKDRAAEDFYKFA